MLHSASTGIYGLVFAVGAVVVALEAQAVVKHTEQMKG